MDVRRRGCCCKISELICGVSLSLPCVNEFIQREITYCNQMVNKLHVSMHRTNFRQFFRREIDCVHDHLSFRALLEKLKSLTRWTIKINYKLVIAFWVWCKNFISLQKEEIRQDSFVSINGELFRFFLGNVCLK